MPAPMTVPLQRPFDRQDQARLRAGDVRALEACYRTHGARVHQICRRVLGNDSDALDAVQEVFLKVFERASQFAGRARFETWLHRVTVNHCLNQLERERRRSTAALDEGAHPAPQATETPTERAEERALLQGLLDRLPDEQRAVLVLRELESMSYAQIAAQLSIPEGTVMSRLARAREKLWNWSGARQPTAEAPDDPPPSPARKGERTR